MAPTTSTTIVDLSRFDAKQLLRARPRGLVAGAKDRRLELRFPKGMTELPQWALDLRATVIDLPGYDGLSVEAGRGVVERLHVGGEKVRLVRVPHGCDVSVPSPAHVDAVRVEWMNQRTGARRLGRPCNHMNRVAQVPSDAKVPRNGSVSFEDDGHESRQIECGHYAAYLDRRMSEALKIDHSVESAVGGERGSTDERLSASHRLAGIVRKRLATVGRVQAEIPRAYDARFCNLMAQSPGATIVENSAFAEWLRTQFAEMSLPDRRTYLLTSRNHAMNLALTTTRSCDGAPVFEAVFLDPNLHTQPSSIRTGNASEIAGWALERFIGTDAMSTYYPIDADGASVPVTTMIRTPRGKDRSRFDAEAGNRMVFEPGLSFFPATLAGDDLFEAFSGDLGSHLCHLRSRLDALPSDRVFDLLDAARLIPRRMSNGAAAEITIYLETVAHLVEIRKLDADHAASLITAGLSGYPFHHAVLEGRPEALERYRQGLEAMMNTGWLTGRYRNWFKPLFMASALRAVDAHAASGVPMQREAASKYRDLLAMLQARIGRPDAEPLVGVRRSGIRVI